MEPTMTLEQKLDAVEKAADEEWRAQMAQEDREWEEWKRRRDAEDAEAQRKAERIGFWLNVVGITCGIAWVGCLAIAIYLK